MKRIVLLGILSLFLSVGLTSAQDDMFKALFIYNFTKDIQWPDTYAQGDFVIGVMGASPIVEELEKIALKKKVGVQTMVIKKLNTTADIGKCNIVFLPAAKSSMLSSVITAVKGKPTLIISDKPGLAKEGAGINFVMVDGKQKFEINTTAITSSGLKITTFLINLGIKVQ